MTAQPQTETAPERALRSVLHGRGLRFRKHVAPLPALRCRADIVFRTQQIAVFVDGCFWHFCPKHGSVPKANAEWWREKLERNVARDRRNDQVLEREGWTVLRVWEHEDPRLAADNVESLVKARSLRVSQ
jgi:DNA mismatch endonuclease (patch repair protein)